MGRRAPEENAFLSSLRPNINGRTAGRVYSNRASSAPRERQPNWQESHDRQAYTKANRAWAGSDEAHKFNSNRTASAHFADSLRDWPRATDVAKKTPPNWRVSAADTFGGRDLFGTSADDLSLNNAEDWKHSNKIRADELFHAGLRGVDKNASWQGQDVGYDDQGRPKKQQAKRNDKDVKNLTVGNVGDSIIRQPENMFGPWQNMVRHLRAAPPTYCLRAAPPACSHCLAEAGASHLSHTHFIQSPTPCPDTSHAAPYPLSSHLSYIPLLLPDSQTVLTRLASLCCMRSHTHLHRTLNLGRFVQTNTTTPPCATSTPWTGRSTSNAAAVTSSFLRR